MSLGGAPKVEAAKAPARKADRVEEVKPDEIQIGSGDDDASQTAKGKRSLVRPVSSSLGGI